MKYLLVLAISVAIVYGALCPNVCSGHGTCTKAGTCTCNPTYSGGDCSLRTCPYGMPYVDPSFEDQTKNPDHNYLECSGQGECDRASGLCVCHKGYEGANCGRLTCPNGCSGHGVCTATRYLDNEGTQYFQKEDTKGYKFWDKDQSHVCFCDEEYTGYDCSMKKCAYGYMATSDCDELEGGNTQKIDIETGTGSDNYIYLAYLKYTDPFGRVWFSDYFDVTHANATVLYNSNTDNSKKILATIPGWNNVVNSFPPGVLNVEKVVVYELDGKDIKSNMDGTDDIKQKLFKSNKVQVQITYGSHQTGRQGENLEILIPDDISKNLQSSDLSYHGLSNNPTGIVKKTLDKENDKFYYEKDEVTVKNLENEVKPLVNPDLPSPSQCANNGICNGATGLCECFKGFYGLACTEQLDLL